MTNFEDNPNIPKYIKRKSEYETCYWLKNLQDCIRSVEIIKNIKPSNLCLSFDTETHEFKHELLLEVGWCIFNINDENYERNVVAKHFIVKENRKCCNRKRVPNNKNNFNFGKSETRTLNEIKGLLENDLNKVDFLLGQGISNDTKEIDNLGIDIKRFKNLNGNLENSRIIDTRDLYEGCFHEKGISLEKGLKKFNIKYKFLHNAGNYIYFGIYLNIFSIIDYNFKIKNNIIFKNMHMSIIKVMTLITQ